MARQKGSASFAGTLEVLAGGPLDARSQVPTKADLTVASNFPYSYVGMETFVLNEKKKYRLIGQDPTDIDNWEVEGSGGSVDTSKLYSTDDTVSTDLADDDYVPFYDVSASGKKKSLWSNIKFKLKTYFDTLYATLNGHSIQSNGTALEQEDALNFIGFDVADNDSNGSTDVSAHELTTAELTEIMSTLPGQPTQGITIDLRGNEQVVGKVIESDGTEKTLYQKTIEFPVGSLPTVGTTETKPHNIANLGIVVSSDFIVTNNISSPYHKFALAWTSGSNMECVRYNINNTDIAVSVPGNSSDLSNWFGYCTFCYTKTTS